MDGLALYVGLRGKIADDLAARRHLDAPCAGFALQHLLEIFLQPILPDLVAGRDVQRILGLLIFLGVRGADIADQMADRGAGRVIAGKAALRRDAGQFGQADEDRAIFGLGHVLLDRDRLEPRCRLQVAIDPLHRVAIEPEQRLELPENHFLVVQAVGNEVDAERNAIVRERRAMAVDDPAAARGDQRQIDAVAFRFEDVAIIVDHRNIGHARRERDADRRLRPADDERAAGEGYAPPGFGDRRTLLLRHRRIGTSLSAFQAEIVKRAGQAHEQRHEQRRDDDLRHDEAEHQPGVRLWMGNQRCERLDDRDQQRRDRPIV